MIGPSALARRSKRSNPTSSCSTSTCPALMGSRWPGQSRRNSSPPFRCSSRCTGTEQSSAPPSMPTCAALCSQDGARVRSVTRIKAVMRGESFSAQRSRNSWLSGATGNHFSATLRKLSAAFCVFWPTAAPAGKLLTSSSSVCGRWNITGSTFARKLDLKGKNALAYFCSLEQVQALVTAFPYLDWQSGVQRKNGWYYLLSNR